jgi:hypothetical protein
VRFGRRAVEGLIIAGIGVRKRFKQPSPNPSHRPAAEPIVDRRRRTVDRRAILPPASGLQNMNDPTDHPPIVRPARAWLVLRKQRFDRSPLPITQPKFPSHDSNLSPIRLESQPDNPLNNLIEFAA